MSEPYYVTTSIAYVNAAPHIGYALEMVQADAFARYYRLRGADTRFLTGTDENSLKNVRAAEREGIPTEQLVDRNARVFAELAEALGISNDDFIRTAVEPRHVEGATKFWRACERSGDVYTRRYRGLYCVGCEQFYTEDELSKGLCEEHGARPEEVEEENYFFRLSRYGDRLADLIDSGRIRIIPETRRNEVAAFIARGLEDFSISRSRQRSGGWGIDVPGDPSQVMYVWFDALTNYVTALGYADDAALYRRYWAENRRRVHVIGKGILRFHAVYWPAMLLSAGLPLPDEIFVHGYLTIGGQKMSKSLGNVVDPIGLVRRYGVDAVRYWLLRAMPPTGDADYTDEKLEARYTADLANDLGNLLNRTLSMLHRYRRGVVPAPGHGASDLEALVSTLDERLDRAIRHDYDSQSALGAIWELVAHANRYVEETARGPWLGPSAPVRRMRALASTASSTTWLSPSASSPRRYDRSCRPPPSASPPSSACPWRGVGRRRSDGVGFPPARWSDDRSRSSRRSIRRILLPLRCHTEPPTSCHPELAKDPGPRPGTGILRKLRMTRSGRLRRTRRTEGRADGTFSDTGRESNVREALTHA